jgi:hypothetical protein
VRVKLLGIMLLCVVGCDVSSEDATELSVSEHTLSIDKSISRPSEDVPLYIAENSNGFAGYYCSDGDLWVGLVQGTTAANAAMVINLVNSSGAAFYCHNRNFPNHEPQIKTIDKKYSFMQLRSWRDSVGSDFFKAQNGRRIGINYTRNKIVARVAQGTAPSNRLIMQSHGIPDDAVEIVEVTEFTPNACSSPSNGPNLYGCFRPVPGGVVTFSKAVSGPDTSGCTLTAMGTLTSSAQNGFVTAAHCATPVGQDQNWAFYQYDYNIPAEWMGTESVDPAASGIACYLGFSCRKSDAVWVSREAQTAHKGQIAQTLSWYGTSNCCSSGCAACIINNQSPRFHIYGSANPIEGAQVEKVGVTSGWTTGTISDTCDDRISTGTGIIFTCQSDSNYLGEQGDSGAPVFYWWWSYGVSTVQLVGVHSGWDQDVWGNTYRVFSPWSSVVQEIGNIDIKYAPTWAQETSESARDVGVGANGHVWIISNTAWAAGGGYYIKRRLSNGTWDTPGPGAALRIAVDPSGNAWVVNNLNQIWRWTGSAWSQLPGTATDIGVGANGSVWIIGTTPDGYGNYSIGVWNGSSWTVIDGAALRISVDPSGLPWVVSSDNRIWRRVGGTWGTWQQMPSLATDIGIAGDGMVWMLGTTLASTGGGYEIFWWSGIDWQKVFGGGIAISAERGGKPWEATNIYTLWHGL